jgi:hypothetical protein
MIVKCEEKGVSTGLMNTEGGVEQGWVGDAISGA